MDLTISLKRSSKILLFLYISSSIYCNTQIEASSSSSSSSSPFILDGTVLNLDESTIDSAISSFDYILLDFYAPWCGHCKRLNPQLDVAARMLAELNQTIVIAKIDADKYPKVAQKHDIDGYPTLKIFMHGIPVEYNGPRKADLLVRYLKKFVAPDITVLESDSSISKFIESAGTYFPIYIGFGLNESMLTNVAIKNKKKAWFSVAKDFSEDVMVQYDFDKIPALVSFLPNFEEKGVFYGPFEDEFLDEFIKQSLIPLVMPINEETLKLLRDDDRKIVLAIVKDAADENSLKLIKLLKAAASANRDLVFGYAGVKQWEDLVDTFGVNKKTLLPKMIVWDGNEEYASVIGFESIHENDQWSQISRFLEGYREGNVKLEKIGGPSLFGFMASLDATMATYILIFLVAMIFMIQHITKDEPPSDGRRKPNDDTSSSSSAAGDNDRVEYTSGDKED